MYLKQLDITGIRNLRPIRLYFNSGINAFYGENGSGKTSILEAIHVLGLGSSFRTANLQQIIQFEQSKYLLAGIVEESSNNDHHNVAQVRIGTEKTAGSKSLFIKDGEKCAVSSIARLLPLQLINSNSVVLLDGGPSWRRNFIDIGMFHVEQSYLEIYQQFKRCLLQRNAELKTQSSPHQKRARIEAWNEPFIAAGEAIDAARRNFINDFTEIFNKLMADWPFCGRVSFQYKQGWSDGFSLKEALEESFFVDLASGCTNKGPHRAELEIYVDKNIAKNLLSRGQQKVFSCALSLARAIFLQEKEQINSVFLVDDLNSELDKHSYQLILNKLQDIGGQIFITEIEKKASVYSFNKTGTKMFHVEHGAIHTEETALSAF